MDVNGQYDRPLVNRLLPLMKKFNVSGYFQGHRHTIEHAQETNFNNPDDVHFFTVGAGALIEHKVAKSFLNGIPEETNACYRDGSYHDQAFCHYFWHTRTYTGSYAYVTVSSEGAKVEYIESDFDKLLYSYTVPPRKNRKRQS